MNDKTNVVTIDPVEAFAKFIAEETYKMIRASGKAKGASRTVTLKFIQYFMTELLFSTLTEFNTETLTPIEAFTKTNKNFTDVKNDIQDEVANAFQESFKRFTTKDVEYVCIIRPVPEPISKVLN